MPQTQQEIIESGKQVLIGNYARVGVSMARGQGSWLWDADGKKYLDLFAGFGGTILGHCHPDLIAAMTQQAKALWAVGNTFYSQPQIEVAQRLKRHAFDGQAFFCHSGAEANESACKLARLRGSQNGGKKWKIITLNRSFHGRTLAMIAATGNPTYSVGFGPAVPGFVHVEGGDFDALAAVVDDETCGILMEPIQGEGGINQFPADFPLRVRQLCDQRGMSLIFDEVWTGCGRTGRWFAYQHFASPGGAAVEPDILTLGKAVGGGIPVGVMWAKPSLASLMVPGTHGCTLGGNPICMAVSRAVFDVIERDNLVAHAMELGELAISRFNNDAKVRGRTAQVRGRGLMLGIELKEPPEKFVDKALERGLVANLTAKKVIRLAPAINISRADWETGLNMVCDLIAAL